jgi:hypothetical protein
MTYLCVAQYSSDRFRYRVRLVDLCVGNDGSMFLSEGGADGVTRGHRVKIEIRHI